MPWRNVGDQAGYFLAPQCWKRIAVDNDAWLPEVEGEKES